MYANIISSSRLSGIQKAAIVVLSLGDAEVEKVLSRLDDDEIRDLSQVMANIGRVDPLVVEEVVNEFIDKIGSSNMVLGSLDATERILMRVMPKDRVQEIMASIRGPQGRTMWDKLSNVNESVLANYLKNEYPQSVALILSKVHPEHASKVITHFGETFVLDVMLRILGLDPIQDEVLNTVEQTLTSEFINNLSQARIRDGHQILADIFNNFDRPTSDKMLELLETQDFDAAERIRSLMLTFEDLVALDPVHLQILLRNVNHDKLVIALKGAPDAVARIFFDNMSERAGRVLREDMSALGPTRLRVIEESQLEVIGIAKNLADQGEIDLVQGGARDQYVK